MAVRLWRIELWWNWEEGGFIEKVAEMEDYVWLQDVKWLPKKSNGKKRIVRALGRTNMQAPQPPAGNVNVK